ncbi:MAG: hypothetical protein IPM32_02305 [Ignavibacteriae bacterium]|nr:hypothetical protein [Ignavibacteriota bacterium]
MRKYLFIILFFIINGCEEEDRLLETMYYNQLSCRGGCPVYEITISSDRILRYVGKRYVSNKDTIYESVTLEQIKKLTNAFDECNYFLLKDKYNAIHVTDMASAITSIDMEGKYKRIEHYFGDSSAPEELKNLYIKINEILNTEKWTGKKPIFTFP